MTLSVSLHHAAHFSTMVTTSLPHDTIAPSITLLHNTTAYNDPLLDEVKANYKPWLKSMDLFLTLTGFIGYVTGAISEPSNSEPCTLTNWRANDTMAAALISSTI